MRGMRSAEFQSKDSAPCTPHPALGMLRTPNSALREVVKWLVGSVWVVSAVTSAAAVEEHAVPSYDSKGKRDPFVALVHEGRFVGTGGTLASASQPSDLHLAGILWDPSGRSIALINDAEVTIGEMVGDYQVVEIQQETVTVMREGKPITLQLSFENRESTPEEPNRR